MKKKTILQCPNCTYPLMQGEKQYFCAKGHSFDIAGKGYVNLLLPGHTGAGTPGDSRELLRSRREFLDKGYYERFSDQLNELADSALQKSNGTGETTNLLDVGCGEGYYIARLKKRLTDLYGSKGTDYYGIDVSKNAVYYAAGRDKDIRFAVASNYHIPVLKRSVDCILCIFAPRDEKEFRRILKPGGEVVVAAPGAKHLYSFRKLLYESPELIGQKGTLGEGFKLLEQRNVSWEFQLDSKEDVWNLFMMTPYSRHADVEAVKNLQEFSTEADIVIRVYRKA